MSPLAIPSGEFKLYTSSAAGPEENFERQLN
jgi:hypothetical protein